MKETVPKPQDKPQTKARGARIQTKSQQRRQKHKEDLRLAILDAATELFLENGYEKFSLRQVAEAVGYSPTTIYHHFQDKDELLFHVSLEGFRSFGEMLQAAYESKENPLERLEAIGDAYIEFGLEYPVHYRLMFMQRPEMFFDGNSKKFEMPEAFSDMIDSFGVLQKNVQECIDAEIFQSIDSQLLSGIIWANIHGAVALCISGVGVDEGAARAINKHGHKLLIKGLQKTNPNI